MATLETVGGLEYVYGPSGPDRSRGAKRSKGGSLKEAVYIVEYDNLPNDDTGNEMILEIPAHAVVTAARFQVIEAFAGGTSYTVGLEQEDGTVIDADGIFTAAELPLASIDAVGEAVVASSGALVGAEIGANDAVVAIVASGTFTAGKALLVIEYSPYLGDAA